MSLSRNARNAALRVLIALAVLLLALFSLSGCQFRPASAAEGQQAGRFRFEEARFRSFGEGFSDSKILDGKGALQALESLGGPLGFQSAADCFELENECRVGDRVFYRFRQTHKGLAVLSRSMTVVAGKGGKPEGAIGNYINVGHVPFMPEAPYEYAENVARRYFSDATGSPIESVRAKPAGLAVYTLAEEPFLCWGSTVSAPDSRSGAYASATVYLRAVCEEIPSLFVEESYLGPSPSRLPLEQLRAGGEGMEGILFDSGRNIGVFAMDGEMAAQRASEGEGGASARWAAQGEGSVSAQNAFANLAKAYDYFSQALGRRQFDGKGSFLPAVVNAYAPGKENAAYDASKTFFDAPLILFTSPGRGMAEISDSLDAVAHEYAHGVIGTAAGLCGDEMPGALSESLCDAFGEMAEAWHGGSCDWIARSERDLSLKAASQGYRPENGPHANSQIPGWALGTIGKRFMAQGLTQEFSELLYSCALLIPPTCSFSQFASSAAWVASLMEGDGKIPLESASFVRSAFEAAGMGPNAYFFE
jgi:hypothetical protein